MQQLPVIAQIASFSTNWPLYGILALLYPVELLTTLYMVVLCSTAQKLLMMWVRFPPVTLYWLSLYSHYGVNVSMQCEC